MKSNECTDPPVYPQCPDNRPGLSRIRRRIGTYATIRESLLYQLDRDPFLSGWSHREADDPGIALLEGAAIVGDILTFYQELYANEAYLETARWRESVSDLVRLIGYRLAPGVGGRAIFAFEISGDLPVTIPAGFPVAAQLAEMDEQAEFQVTDPVVAWPGLSRFTLYPPLVEQTVSASTTEFLVDAPGSLQIDKGDRFLIGEPDNPSAPDNLKNPEIVIVDDVQTWHGERLLTIKGHLQRTIPVDRLGGYKINRSFRHFGHAAPPANITIGSDGVASQYPISYERSLNSDDRSHISPSVTALEMPIDETVDDLAQGGLVICQFTTSGSAGQTCVRSIVSVRQGTYTWGAITGPSTVITLNAPLVAGAGNISYPDEGFIAGQWKAFAGTETSAVAKQIAMTYSPVAKAAKWSELTETVDIRNRVANKFGDIRNMAFHEASSPFVQFRAKPVPTTNVRGAVLSFEGTASLANKLTNRQMLLAGPGDTVRMVMVQLVASAVGGHPMLHEITLDSDVDYADFPMVNPAITAFANLAPATQGKSEPDAVLGNGDSRAAFQTFALPKRPLTYLLDPSATPPTVPQLDVYVNNRRWTRIPSLVGAKPIDQVYIVREDDEATSYVQFGDGITGARTPSGIGNIVARFRTGNRAFGQLADGATPSAGTRLDRLDAIALPGIVTGGSSPESANSARQSAPGTIQSVDRFVSLRDYETETLALPGVSLVQARWSLVDNIPSVTLTVLMDTGRDAEIEQIRSILTTATRKRGPARYPVFVVAGTRLNYAVTTQVAIDDSFQHSLVLEQIRRELKVAGLPGNDSDGTAGRTFGEWEYASRIEGTIQVVPGVRWVRVTSLHDIAASRQLATLLYGNKARRQTRLVPGPNEVLALHNDHLFLQPIVARATGGG